MIGRDSGTKNERYLGYLMGAGVALMILALLLEGLGTIDNGATTGSIFVVGLALFLLGLLTWLYMFKPWRRFDDLKTPHYTGEHAPDKAASGAAHDAAGVKAAAAEAAKAAQAVAEASAQAASDAAAKVSAAAPEPGALATVPTPKTAIEPHVIPMPPPRVEDAAKAAAEAVKSTVEAAQEAVQTVADKAEQVAEDVKAAVPEPAAAEAPAVAEAPSRSAAAGKPDDLTLIEGIGPKTNKALIEAGVTTFAALAAMTPDAISALLAEAKVRIVSPPDTWPQQAKLAADGDMDGLAALQARLKGGLARD